MTVTGAASYQTEDFVGNEALAVKPDGGNPVRIQFRVTMTPYTYKDALAKYRPEAAIPDEARKYLGKSEWLDPTSPKLLEIVKPLRRDSPVETVEQILAYERSRLTYVLGSTFRTAEDVLEQRKAVCFGWSAAFTGLCRRAGIPARMVDVLAADYPSSKFDFHTYCEFYVPGAAGSQSSRNAAAWSASPAPIRYGSTIMRWTASGRAATPKRSTRCAPLTGSASSSPSSCC